MTEVKQRSSNIGQFAIRRSRRLHFFEKHMFIPPFAHIQTIEKRGSERQASEVATRAKSDFAAVDLDEGLSRE